MVALMVLVLEATRTWWPGDRVFVLKAGYFIWPGIVVLKKFKLITCLWNSLK
jgi:hypothetical protein